MLNGEALRDRIDGLMARLQSDAPDSIGARLQLQLVDCSGDGKECCFRCTTESWMRNAFGTIHGGISSSILDQAMGFLTMASMEEEGLVATVQMQESYHNPVFVGGPLLVRVRILSSSKSLHHLSGEIVMESMPDRICVSATSVYYYRPMDLKNLQTKK